MSATRMYRVNEIFYSLQAEGANAGRAAVFVRLSGCNLACPFCDTDHEPFREMDGGEICAEVDRLASEAKGEKPIVVFTGGEPTLQLSEDEPLCEGYFRAIETNGTRPTPSWIQWVTVSPKTIAGVEYAKANEIKVLFGWYRDEYILSLEQYAKRRGIPLYIQPTADKDGKFNPLPVVDFIMRHPRFRLSLQWHKIFNIR